MELPSPTESITQKIPDIDFILEQYHSNTKEKDLPYHEWIRFKDHLPLDENKPILIYDKQWSSMYDGVSFVQLQHALYDKYTKHRNDPANAPSHWMRIKKPEE
jgi:hypothetical protein